MMFRPLSSPNLKVVERDTKLQLRKCKCSHHQDQQCLTKRAGKPLEEIEEITSRLHHEAQQLKTKKLKEQEKTKAMKEQKEMESCTFTPSILENPEYFVTKSSFLEREMTWSESKVKKINSAIEKKNSLELVGCQFKPKIIAIPKLISEKPKHTPVKKELKPLKSSGSSASYSALFKKNSTQRRYVETKLSTPLAKTESLKQEPSAETSEQPKQETKVEASEKQATANECL